MADPQRRTLIDATNEFLHGVRKSFGMHGQISVLVTDIDPTTLTTSIAHHRFPADMERTVWNVRNAVLMWLQDMLPCAELRAVCETKAAGTLAEFTVPFVRAEDLGRDLPSQLILIWENHGPKLEAERERFRRLWRRAFPTA